jgi:hypothetical protein
MCFTIGAIMLILGAVLGAITMGVLAANRGNREIGPAGLRVRRRRGGRLSSRPFCYPQRYPAGMSGDALSANTILYRLKSMLYSRNRAGRGP